MRRTDRQVTDLNAIREILSANQVCTLSIAVENEPYGVMLNYGYEMDETGKLILYFHCATAGRKNDMLLKNPAVAFSIFGDVKVEGEELPCSYTTRYASVMGSGTVTIIEEDEAKRAALDILMHNHGMTGKGTYDAGMLARVWVLRLDVASYSAKRNQG